MPTKSKILRPGDELASDAAKAAYNRTVKAALVQPRSFEEKIRLWPTNVATAFRLKRLQDAALAAKRDRCRGRQLIWR
jgi:hypothetical protein